MFFFACACAFLFHLFFLPLRCPFTVKQQQQRRRRFQRCRAQVTCFVPSLDEPHGLSCATSTPLTASHSHPVTQPTAAACCCSCICLGTLSATHFFFFLTLICAWWPPSNWLHSAGKIKQNKKRRKPPKILHPRRTGWRWAMCVG